MLVMDEQPLTLALSPQGRGEGQSQDANNTHSTHV